MLRIPFEGLEFAFELFESLLKGSNFYSNASKIHFEWLEFALECFVSLSNGSNALNPFQVV